MTDDRKQSYVIKIAAGCLCLLMLLAGGCSTSSSPSSPNAVNSSNAVNSNAQQAAPKVSLFGERFSFVPPDGFKPLPAAEIKRELPDNVARENIYSNADQTAYVAVTLDPEMPLEPAQLTEVKGYIERVHQKYSGWKTSEIIEMSGRQWFHFEWEKPLPSKEMTELVAPVPVDEDGQVNSNAVQNEAKKKKDLKPIYYRSYTTSLNRQMLTVTLEADADVYPKVKEAFEKSLRTIQTKD